MALTFESESAVTIKTDAARLAQIDDAIDAIETGAQSYTLFGSRQVTKADLTDLYALRTRYEKRVLYRAGFTGRNVADGRGQGNLDPGDVDSD